MADTARSKTDIIGISGDNSTGAISAQDYRDFIVSVMPTECLYAGEYWTVPTEVNNTTTYSTRGTHIFSQIVSSKVANGLSFGKVYALTASNTWSTADPDNTYQHTLIGVAADSYAINVSTAKLLLMGVVNNPSCSDYTVSCVGLPLFLCSVTSAGNVSITAADNSRVVGIVLPSGIGQSTAVGSGKYFFDYRGWCVLNH